MCIQLGMVVSSFKLFAHTPAGQTTAPIANAHSVTVYKERTGKVLQGSESSAV